MRCAKPSTNATSSKRVDHGRASHRPPPAPAEATVCPSCGAVYARHHWSDTPPSRACAGTDGTSFGVQICPSCRRRRTGVPRGYLHIDGEFFRLHRAEIEQFLHNEVVRSGEDNPRHQVLGWEYLEGEGLLITASTERLVQRLGEAIEKAYDSEVDYGFSLENKVARVWWHR
jgi:NMD protein affecting ribosome stability and mRNA decay